MMQTSMYVLAFIREMNGGSSPWKTCRHSLMASASLYRGCGAGLRIV